MIKQLIALLVISIGFLVMTTHCKKNDPTPTPLGCKLSKIEYIYNSTGLKYNSSTLLSYNNNGTLKTEYDSANTLGLGSFTAQYNTSGQVVKMVFQDNLTDYKIYTYDSSGKIIESKTYFKDDTAFKSRIYYVYQNGKMSESNFYSGYKYLENRTIYTWLGDNIVSTNYYSFSPNDTINSTKPGSIYSTVTTTYSNFDSSLNPNYMLYQSLGIPSFGGSKNNYANYTTTTVAFGGTISNSFTFVLTYDSNNRLIKSVQPNFTQSYIYTGCN